MTSTAVLFVLTSLCGFSSGTGPVIFGSNAPAATPSPSEVRPLSFGTQNYLQDTHIKKDEGPTGSRVPLPGPGGSKASEDKAAFAIMKVTKNGGFQFQHAGLNCILSREREDLGRLLSCNGRECDLHKEGVWNCEALNRTCHISVESKKASCGQTRGIIKAPQRDCPAGHQRRADGICQKTF